MNLFALIGFPLKHSFSKKYFTEKFEKLGISDTHRYELLELEDYHNFPKILAANTELKGMNVTIPHKQNIMPFLTDIHPSAQRIGAVNVIKVNADGTLTGYNSDYFGFKNSLENWLKTNNAEPKNIKALVLGNGGAAKAVKVALEDLEIQYRLVSRKASAESIDYQQANDLIESHQLIVNCSPIGTFPNVDDAPAIDYNKITPKHFLYDLVYNPTETLFMKLGLEKGAKTMNGYEMLVLQAEKSWEIWNG